MTTPKYKIALIGEPGVGKSTLLSQFLTSSLSKKYLATLSVEIHPITLSTSRGPIELDVWETVGAHPPILRDGFYFNASGAIILFDVTRSATHAEVQKWYEAVTAVCGEGIPIALCANKVDYEPARQEVHQKDVRFQLEKANVQLFYMSAAAGLNITAPLVWLAQRLMGDGELRLTEGPEMVPARIGTEEIRGLADWCLGDGVPAGIEMPNMIGGS